MGFVVFFGFLLVLALVVAVAASKRKGGQATTTARETMSQRAKDSMGKVLLDDLALEWNVLYRDSKGDLDVRDITVRAFIGRKIPYYALAFCHLRQEERHFQFDRMERVTDKKTGRDIRYPAEYARSYWDEARGYLTAGYTYQRFLAPPPPPPPLPPPPPVTVAYVLEPPRRIGIRWEEVDFTVEASEHGLVKDRPYFRGWAKRPPIDGKRAWSGNKTFPLHQPHSLFDPDTGEEIADFGEWLAGGSPTRATCPHRPIEPPSPIPLPPPALPQPGP